MYAIINVAGQQFKVKKDQYIYTHRLSAETGSDITIDEVLLTDDENGKVNIGNPVLKDVKVKAKVLDHVRGDKITVFKKKRRKGYQVKNGHRQDFTKLLIADIA